MRRQTSFVAAFIFLTLTLQAQNPRGSLRGTVQDASGARVTGAKIVVESADSAMRREAATEDRGEFRLDDLIPGRYRITVSAAGFAQAQADVAHRGEFGARSYGHVEGSGAVAEHYGGKCEFFDYDAADRSGQRGASGSDQQPGFADAAAGARSFANIAYLAPGTEPVEPSDPTKARITAVSTGGSSGLNNDLSVDGGDNSDDWIGGFLQNFSPDTIQEFAMRTANEDADTGGTTAGSVVITTKRGTNEWHGSGAFYERAASLNARFPIENPAPNPKQPFSRQNYVATLGGPLARNKVWMFSSFEYVHENASIAYSPNSTTQFNALAQLASDGLIPGVPSIRCAAERADSFSRLHGLAAVRLGTVRKIAVVFAHFFRQLPDAQQPGAAGDVAFHGHDHAQQLLEHGHQQHLRVQSDVAGHVRIRRAANCI